MRSSARSIKREPRGSQPAETQMQYTKTLVIKPLVASYRHNLTWRTCGRMTVTSSCSHSLDGGGPWWWRVECMSFAGLLFPDGYHIILAEHRRRDPYLCAEACCLSFPHLTHVDCSTLCVILTASWQRVCDSKETPPYSSNVYVYRRSCLLCGSMQSNTVAVPGDRAGGGWATDVRAVI
jgi:hypothetical protein